MDYGKYKYEAAQRAKDSRKKSTNIVVKELKYRPKIAKGDFNTKTNKVRKFLEDGHKVKLTIMFRGREVQHPELGRKILDDVAELMEDIASLAAYRQLDGRNMTMVLGPDKKAIANLRKEKEKQQEGSQDLEWLKPRHRFPSKLIDQIRNKIARLSQVNNLPQNLMEREYVKNENS